MYLDADVGGLIVAKLMCKKNKKSQKNKISNSHKNK